MLKIQGLECGYGRMKVLEGINFEVGAESVGLFGPNGAGKTTLISAVMGMIKPWKGSIELEGVRIGGAETFTIARMGVALVPQERELFPGMSVEDNLMLGAAYIPHAKDDIPNQLEKVFELFPILKERRTQYAGTMSGGQQRMLAIGRALMSKPRLLILDEPSLGLQPSIVAEVFEVLKSLKSSISILVTEQNVRESLKAIDRGYVLENGRIVLEDSAEGLKTNPHVVKSYLGL
ncbi:MAG: ABC transporter ATP-binding protein [Rectinema subterraneum]|jgi:branched-chain amino acid transport system ATP-binding protein|uniref:Leucine/isoleucine/valine transporter subunit ATP-binding component of ABC superfamily n=1 Tax=uncultured spirochete TaxID=156406 RepID=A0A3P3XLR3_9SPIR|nr:ABC transporter ATP-binding protein [Rectinema subterraneum]SLM15134.1 leucine/isoleucine/valine transporter subunit; ATP-binding component of ABC superfamily [uncultured spirochete]